MINLRRVAAGLTSLLVLTTLLVGVPVALAIAVGWPLPHSWPAASQVRTVLETSGIPDVILIDALALVCWIAWLDFALATVIELGAAATHRTAPRLALARPWQPIVARLVTTIVLAVSAMSMRPPAGATQHATLAVAMAARHPAGPASAEPPPTDPMPRPSGVGHPSAATASGSQDYVVRGGDTLWDISSRRLGDPRRWPEIWRQNEKRPEPAGRRFTDPNLIVPGWRLGLPDGPPHDQAAPPPGPTIPPAVVPPRPQAPPPSAPAPGPTAELSPAPPTTAPTAAPPVSAVAATTPPPAPFPAAEAPTVRPTGGIELPAGGLVGLGFAAGVVASLAAARIHERRHRRVGTVPDPSVDRLVGPTVSRLQRAVTASRAQHGGASGSTEGTSSAASGSGLVRMPGRLPLGVHGPAGAVEVDVVELSGTAFAGPGAEGAVRALLAAMASADWREQAEVLAVDSLARLLCGVRQAPGAEVLADAAAVIARLQRDSERRRGVLEDQAAHDYRALAESPDPLGAVLVVVDGAALSADEATALTTLVSQGRRLGIAVVALGSAPGFETVEVAEDGTVLAAPTPIRTMVERLFVLAAAEAREVLAVLSAGRDGPVQPPPSVPPEPYEPTTPISDEGPTPGAGEDEAVVTRPVVVRLFGPPRVEVNGQEVTTGLREKARELLCLLAVRRAGMRMGDAINEMWREDEDGHEDTFHVSVTGTRRLLRRLTGALEGRFIRFGGERYSLDQDLVDADVWQLEAALAEVTRATDQRARIAALRRVEVLATGEPLEGAGYEWAAPTREYLRRRAVDALIELAQLRGQSGDGDGALAALDRARSVDPASEDVHRRVMRRLADAGRADIALRVYDEIECHAAALGTVPEDETEDLMVTIRLQASGQPATHGSASSLGSANGAGLSAMAARLSQPNGTGASRRRTHPSPQGELSILDGDGIPG